MLGASNRAWAAEDRLWSELLDPPPGERRPVAFRPATWALRELYSRHPCWITRDVGAARLEAVTDAHALFSREAGNETTLELRALPELEHVAARIGLPPGRASTVSLSADGLWILAVVDDQAWVLDWRHGSEWVAGPRQPGQVAAFAGGDRVVSFGVDGWVRRWRAGAIHAPEPPIEVPLVEGSSRVGLSVAADGRRLLLRTLGDSERREYFHRVLDVAQGRIVDSLSGQGSCILTADGRYLVLHGYQLVAFELPSVGAEGAAVRTFRRSGSTRGTIARHPTENVVAWSGAGANGILWVDLAVGEVAGISSGHRAQVLQLEFSPDGCWLVSLDAAGTAKVWSTSRMAVEFGGPDVHVGTILEVRIGAGGRYLASAGTEPNEVAVWDLASRRLLARVRGHVGRVSGVDLHPVHGEWVASTCAAGGVYLDDWRSGDQARRIGAHPDVVEAVCFAPDGSELASVGRRELAIFGLDGTERARYELPPAKRYSTLAWRGDGELLALGQAGSVSGIVWFDRRTERFRRAKYAWPIRALEYSPRLDRFAVGDSAGRISIWVPNGSEPEAFLEPLAGEVYGIAIDEANGLLAGTGRSGSVRVFDLASFDTLLEFAAHEGPVFGLAGSSGSGVFITSGERAVDATGVLEPAELLAWDLFAPDVALKGNLEQRAGDLTARLGRPPRALAEVRAWAETIDAAHLMAWQSSALDSPDERRFVDDRPMLQRVDEARADPNVPRRLERLLKLTRKFPLEVAPRVALAEERAAAGNASGATEAWRQAVERDPRAAWCWREWGAALLRASATDPDGASRRAQALDVLRSATDLDPEDAEAWTLRAEALLWTAVAEPEAIDPAALRQARAAAERARGLEPDRSASHRIRAWIELAGVHVGDPTVSESTRATWHAEWLAAASANVERERSRSAGAKSIALAQALGHLHDAHVVLADLAAARAALDEARAVVPDAFLPTLESEARARYAMLLALDVFPPATRAHVATLVERGFGGR